MVPGDFLLRVWRDRSTLPDLGAYVVTTRASRHAMNQALDFARSAVADERLITELDAFDVYLSALRGFFQEFAPDFRVARTLTNFHSGARTMFPSNPAHHPVTKAARTLRIDAGCLMMIPDGMMLGCSDIARTLCFEESDQAILDTFQSAIRPRLIPACPPGASGRDIHVLATRIISDANPDLKIESDLSRHRKNTGVVRAGCRPSARPQQSRASQVHPYRNEYASGRDDRLLRVSVAG